VIADGKRPAVRAESEIKGCGYGNDGRYDPNKQKDCLNPLKEPREINDPCQLVKPGQVLTSDRVLKGRQNADQRADKSKGR
jgi:hypothetical protein